MKVPKATVGIIVFSVTFYLLVTNFSPYVSPVDVLRPYGVSVDNLLFGGFIYSFTHIGLKHLLANMFFLSIIGTILEQRLEAKHTLAIYIASGWIGGILYTLINPDVWVLGASTAICGLIAALMVVDIKKAIIGVIIALYLTPVIAYPIADWIVNETQSHKEMEIIKNAEAIVNYSQQLKNATGEERHVLEKKINQTYQKIIVTYNEKKSIETGEKTETVTPTSNLIHILGGTVALVYLAIFKRKAYNQLWDDINGVIKFGSSLVSSGVKKLRRR